MYFWRIEQLKTEMAARPLTDREALPYLLWNVTLTTAVSCFPSTTFNVWDGVSAAFSVALVVLGTIYIFRQNGASKGQHFLQRYFAIGWVVGLRWIVALVIAGVPLFLGLESMGMLSEETSWHIFLFFTVAEVILYWRIGFHVRDLARRTAGGGQEQDSGVASGDKLNS
jgi:hypothetical protein